MALLPQNIGLREPTPHLHEDAAVNWAFQELPGRDPYHAWALVELLDSSSGALHEIDLIVLGYGALYVVEIKSYPGRIAGDSRDWLWTPPGETRQLLRANPLALTNRKAKILRSLLERKLPGDTRVPWVEPLVFLSDADASGLSPDGRIGVVTKADFLRAITHGQVPGRDRERLTRNPINKPTMRAVVQGLRALGLRPRKTQHKVGSYLLGKLLAETDAYQDRVATHETLSKQTRRARTYLVPEQTSVERKQQLRRAADREAQLLYEVREHPGILRYSDYVADAPLGPTVLFDSFEDGTSLDRFIRQEPRLSFDDRIELIEQIGRALAHCHKKEVVHGGLSPAAVLVRRNPDTSKLETRLMNFQLGESEEVSGTVHWTELAAQEWAVYQAPELRADPGQRTPEADLFSLGALAYFILTRKDPAIDIVERDAILETRGCLDPRVVDDSIPAAVADAIADATHRVVANRYDDVGEWVELLLAEATAPDPTPTADPLQVRPEDMLGDLLVEKVLGQGASSRVLRVTRESDDRSFALKVSLGPDHDARLAAEAKVLDELRHPRIVRLVERRTIGERTCLLLSLAGERTLKAELRDHGALSLDYATRYGDELLSALDHLEEKDVIHRDIKPDNLGVGSVGKKASSLHLFDFSLVAAPRTEVRVGTAAYRDPDLPARGVWDAAADRYSAAVVLCELLTGKRPAVADDGSRVIPAERFDPTVRDGLVAFFARALAPKAADRFDSAEAMRRAFADAVAGQRSAAVSAAPPTAEPSAADAAPELSPETLGAIAADTPIAALPLSTRAKNALDRAGLLVAGDLLALPDNRLSAIRGVGRLVAKEIHDLRTAWQSVAGAEPDRGPAFFPGYRGKDLMAQAVCAPVDAAILSDAGLHTLAQIAAAPAAQLQALADRHGLDPAALHKLLGVENQGAADPRRPTTLEGWLDVLFPGKTKATRHVRALFGLEGPFEGQLGVAPRQLAAALELTAPAIYQALGRSVEKWAAHPAMPGLTELLRDFLAQEGGAASLEHAATYLAAQLPSSDADATDDLRRLRAAALVRAACEVERGEPGGLRFGRLAGDRPWVLADADLQAELRRLGRAADDLASRDVVAGPGETERALRAALEPADPDAPPSPLAQLAPAKLVRLAAAASERAAASARLEIYPRGMSGQRALELASTSLSSPLSADELRRRVAARYPDAEPLPPRPELDRLVKAHGLEPDPATGDYRLPGERGASLHTSHTRFTSVTPSIDRTISPEDASAAAFDDRVRACLERGGFLLLGITADRAQRAAAALTERYQLRRQSFDAVFLAALKKLLDAQGIDPEVVHETDAAGPAADAWPILTRVCAQAAAQVAAELLPPRQPLLITEPGLIDRYDLTDFLRALVDASRRDDAQAIILLAPGFDAGVPRIESRTVVPGLLPGQMARIPGAWLNADRQEAL